MILDYALSLADVTFAGEEWYHYSWLLDLTDLGSDLRCLLY